MIKGSIVIVRRILPMVGPSWTNAQIIYVDAGDIMLFLGKTNNPCYFTDKWTSPTKHTVYAFLHPVHGLIESSDLWFSLGYDVRSADGSK